MVQKYNDKHAQKIEGGRSMDMITVTAKTVDEAVTKALIELETTSDKIRVRSGRKKEAPDFWGSARNRRSSVLRKKETLEDRAIDIFKPGI